MSYNSKCLGSEADSEDKKKKKKKEKLILFLSHILF